MDSSGANVDGFGVNIDGDRRIVLVQMWGWENARHYFFSIVQRGLGNGSGLIDLKTANMNKDCSCPARGIRQKYEAKQ